MSDRAIASLATGTIAVRADEGSDGRTIYGYAYKWGDLAGPTAEFGDTPSGFDRGAFADWIAERNGRPTPHFDRHDGNVVGGIVFREDDEGLAYEGRVNRTKAGDDYLASLADGYDQVSLEFMVRGATTRRQGKAVLVTKTPRVVGLAGTHFGAFTSAAVAAREEGSGVTDETTEATGTVVVAQEATAEAPAMRAEGRVVPIDRAQALALAQEAAIEVMRGYAERGQLTVAKTDPLAGYRSLGHLFAEAAKRDAAPELRAYAARALADTVFTSGANAGLASGNLVVQDIKRIVEQGRPVITAFGGPRGLADSAGLTLEWAYFNGTLASRVGAQSAEKAEITSLAVDIALATEALVTYAGGSDISYQVIKRGSPSILDAFARITLAAYAVVTDAAAATELETGTVTVDFAEALSAVDLTELTSHIIDASILIKAATGVGAEFVLAGDTAFARAAKLIAPSSTAIVTQGTLNIGELRVGLGGIPIIHAPGITTGKFVASNKLAGAWHEDGPFQASAEDVEHLGRDVAYWGMGAFARYVPAGIVEIYDVTP